MNRAGRALALAAVAAGIISAAWALAPDASPSVATRTGAAERVERIASPGRIEGRTETIDLGSGMDGIVEAVYVREGDRVAKGQPIARIDCRDLVHDAESRKAAAMALRHERARLLRGGRHEEVAAAQAQADAAQARAARAMADMARADELWAQSVISRAEYDRYAAENAVSRAAVAAAHDHALSVAQAPLDEEVAWIDARIAEATASTLAVEARLTRCVVTAPADGEIVRVHTRTGETVSMARGALIASLADTSRLRVRAEVDEVDVARVHIGDTASISASALGDRTLTGRVVEMGRHMGHKSVLTGDPADKRDRDVLDVMVEVDGDAVPGVIGLRVAVVLTRQ